MLTHRINPTSQLTHCSDKFQVRSAAAFRRRASHRYARFFSSIEKNPPQKGSTWTCRSNPLSAGRNENGLEERQSSSCQNPSYGPLPARGAVARHLWRIAPCRFKPSLFEEHCLECTSKVRFLDLPRGGSRSRSLTRSLPRPRQQSFNLPALSISCPMCEPHLTTFNRPFSSLLLGNRFSLAELIADNTPVGEKCFGSLRLCWGLLLCTRFTKPQFGDTP